jgi:hypothetical protein
MQAPYLQPMSWSQALFLNGVCQSPAATQICVVSSTHCPVSLSWQLWLYATFCDKMLCCVALRCVVMLCFVPFRSVLFCSLVFCSCVLCTSGCDAHGCFVRFSHWVHLPFWHGMVDMALFWTIEHNPARKSGSNNTQKVCDCTLSSFSECVHVRLVDKASDASNLFVSRAHSWPVQLVW